MGKNNPEYLADLDKFAQWARQQPEVVQVNSMTDIMRRLNKNMHGDDETWNRIPDNRELAAQYLVEAGLTQFTVANRTLERAQELVSGQIFAAHDAIDIEQADLDQLVDVIVERFGRKPDADGKLVD